jgi:hypothetical protein
MQTKPDAQMLNSVLRAENCDARLDRHPSAVTRYALGATYVEIDWHLTDGVVIRVETAASWYRSRAKYTRTQTREIRLTDVLAQLDDEATDAVTHAMNYWSTVAVE